MPSATSYDNTSYLFLPLRLPERVGFSDFLVQVQQSGCWDEIDDNPYYLFKYITDKVMAKDRKKRLCFHFRLLESARPVVGIPSRQTLCHTQAHKQAHASRGGTIRFRFYLESVDLFCFRTKVCAVVLRVSVDAKDPVEVSSALYYLKSAASENVTWTLESGQFAQQTLLGIAEGAFIQTGLDDPQFFFFSNRSRRVSNVLTYLEVGANDDYGRELFYLRNCYDDGFLYDPVCDSEHRRSETLVTSPSVTWGFTSEAAVCLACTERPDREFVKEEFSEEFRRQYLFMYMFLLHQKYMLYHFLTDYRTSNESLDSLESYRAQLFGFEADYLYTRITEVTQYQALYERLSEAFSLKEMFEDVREPLRELEEQRRQVANDREAERDAVINRALFWLSVLAVFSAWIDGMDFVSTLFGVFMGSEAADASLLVKGVQLAVVVGIAVTAILVLRRIHSAYSGDDA